MKASNLRKNERVLPLFQSEKHHKIRLRGVKSVFCSIFRKFSVVSRVTLNFRRFYQKTRKISLNLRPFQQPKHVYYALTTFRITKKPILDRQKK